MGDFTACSKSIRDLAAANGWTTPFMHDRRGVLKFLRGNVVVHVAVSRLTGSVTGGRKIVDNVITDMGGPNTVRGWIESSP